MRSFFLKVILPLLFVFGLAWYFYNSVILNQNSFFYFSYCDSPIQYRIGSVDPQFNLSENQFLKDTVDAAGAWNQTYGKNLLIYNPKGTLVVNLVFDQRQSLDNQIQGLENNLQNGKSSLDSKIAQYQSLSANFKQQLDALNSEINDWNSKGGAPPDVYKQLIARQKDLQTQADSLNAMAKTLNQSTQDYNSQVSQLNQTVDSFNQVLSQKPEEGIYHGDTQTIDIYFNVSQTELVHTLTHELGHAIGLGHNSNPNSIMYPYTNQSITPSKDDIAALDKVCEKHTLAQLEAEKMALFLHNLIIKYQKSKKLI